MMVVFMMGIIATAQEKEPTIEVMDNGKSKVTFYHENGKIAQQGMIADGKRDGEWLSYDVKGNKTAQAEYTADKKTGKWFIWTDAELIEIDYRDNRVASVNKWVNKDAIADNRP